MYLQTGGLLVVASGGGLEGGFERHDGMDVMSRIKIEERNRGESESKDGSG